MLIKIDCQRLLNDFFPNAKSWMQACTKLSPQSLLISTTAINSHLPPENHNSSKLNGVKTSGYCPRHNGKHRDPGGRGRLRPGECGVFAAALPQEIADFPQKTLKLS